MFCPVRTGNAVPEFPCQTSENPSPVPVSPKSDLELPESDLGTPESGSAASAHDVHYQARDGHEDGRRRDDRARRVADVRVLRLRLVRCHVDDVVLFQVVVRGEDDVRLVEVQRHDFPLARRVLADELHVVAHPIHRHVARHRKRFQHVHFLVAHRERPRTVHLPDDRNLVVRHPDGHDGGLLQVGEQLLADHPLSLALGQASHLQAPQHGEVYLPVVVHQVLLERRSARRVDVRYRRVQGRLGRQVERRGRLRVRRVHRDGDKVFRHDARVVQRFVLDRRVHTLRVLQVGHVLIRRAARKAAGQGQQHQQGLQFHMSFFLIYIRLLYNMILNILKVFQIYQI